MKLRWIAGIPALLMGAAIIAVAPQASAAPNPGDRCPTAGATADNLICSGQSFIWISTDAPHNAPPGSACDQPGAVTYGRGESLVKCQGSTWQSWSPPPMVR